jgi:perosamine synthetase
VSARVPHSRPFLPSSEGWIEVRDRLTPGWIADGPCGEQFAREAAGWLGGIGGVAVNSGTSALHLALLAVGVGPGAEVLVPAYCCAALLHAVQMTGATPMLVDAESGGFNPCPFDARRRRTHRSAAIVVAHMFGRAAPISPFLELGLPVIEDCAQSLGATDGRGLTGSRGAVAISSFYATKVITTGQGGLVATRDPAALATVRDLVQYDNRDDWRPRFNYNLSELQAALGLWQLERLPCFLKRRQALASYYDEQLLERGADMGASGGEGGIWFRYTIRVKDAATVIVRLQQHGIDAKRPVYRPLHHYLGGSYPHAQAAHEEIVSLPLYPSLTDAEAERVMAAVRSLDLGIRRG